MRPHVSYSEMMEFASNCQWRWKLNYLDNLRKPIFSIHFDFGTAVHEAMENFLRRKDPVTLDEAVSLFKGKLLELVMENGDKYKEPLPDKDLNALLVAGERVIRTVKETPELQGIEVVYNEYPLFEDIDRTDGTQIKFKGFIDIVIKAKDKRGNTILYVCDFKTCSWGWDRDTREDRYKHYQIFLYKYYLCKKFDLDPKNVRVAFILLKKRPAKGVHPVEFFPVSAGPVSVQRALDFMNSTITEMCDREKDMSYKKDRSNCIDKFGNACPYKGTPLCE